MSEGRQKLVRISELAAVALQESLEASGVEPEKGLRLREEDNQFILELDGAKETDRVIRHNGAMVIIVDRSLEAKIGDALIDVESDWDEPDLVIRRAGQA